MPEGSSEQAREAGTIQNAAALNAPQNGNWRRTSIPHFNGSGFGSTNRGMICVIVYLALLMDNILLTVIVPILPDYLASLNNQTLYPPTTTGRRPRIRVDGGGIAFHFFAPRLAYRNQTNSSQSPLRTTMTKHPIPGKSMVNFSTKHLVEDRIAQGSQAYEQNLQQQPQYQQQYLTVNGNISSTDVVKIVPSSNFIVQNSSQSIRPDALTPSSEVNTKSTVDVTDGLEDENGSIGLLLAMKALVQLIFNPIVGNMSSKFGYRLPIFIGTFCLFISSLVFAVGETYITLLLARAIQGVGSACIGVCGMSLVAEHYPEEDRRSKVMGIILGSIALGVLIGYPFGGFLYDIFGKPAPFIILSSIIFVNIAMQLIVVDLSVHPELISEIDLQKPKWKPLIESKMVLAIIVAIWFSTSTITILEPCLPIWLMQNLKPTKWQLGTVFIPDSIGYFVGTNFFGSIAYKYGQIKISCISLLVVGISSFFIPTAKSMAQLLLPHFCLGLAVGIIDAALVPLLATFVDAILAQDEEGNDGGSALSSYGTIYCLQQTSVSLAYCLAPLIGGELAEAVGFPWLMRIVGSVNIAYGPILVYLYQKYDPKMLRQNHNEMLLINTDRGGSQYKQLYNSLDTE